MRFKRTIVILIIILFPTINMMSQTLSFSKSVYDKVGVPGIMVTGELHIKNIGTDTAHIIITRIYKNMPVNWTPCLCYMQCNPKDTLRLDIAPTGSVLIGVGFNTDTIPGIGYVRLALQTVGNTSQKDTLSFSGSTLAAGVRDVASGKMVTCYPNPTTDKVFLRSESNEIYSVIVTDISGKSIKQYTPRSIKNFEMSFENYPNGEYFIRATNESNQSETKKIIKNN